MHPCYNCQSEKVQSHKNCWQQWRELYHYLAHVAIKPFPLVASYATCSPYWMLSLPKTFWFSVWTVSLHLTCECTGISPNYAKFLTMSLLSLLGFHLSSWVWFSSSIRAACWCFLHYNCSTRLATLNEC